MQLKFELTQVAYFLLSNTGTGYQSGLEVSPAETIKLKIGDAVVTSAYET